MTIAHQEQREQVQRPQPDQPEQRAAASNRAHAAEQRNAAAAVSTAVSAARAERNRAKHLGADRRRLADAFEVLSGQINGREDMSVLEPENVLRHDPGAPEQGTGNMAAVCEFVARIMAGQLPGDALEEMHEARLERLLAPAVRHATASHERAHRLENAATVPAALPPAGVVSQPSNGQLPRREPIAPSQPPMVPPAPPEKPTEQTGQIMMRAVDALREAGKDTTASEAAFAASYGHAAGFAASSIPHARSGDTMLLPLVVAGNEHAPAEAPVADGADDGRQAPRPFDRPGAVSGSPSGSGAVDDD